MNRKSDRHQKGEEVGISESAPINPVEKVRSPMSYEIQVILFVQTERMTQSLLDDILGLLYELCN